MGTSPAWRKWCCTSKKSQQLQELGRGTGESPESALVGAQGAQGAASILCDHPFLVNIKSLFHCISKKYPWDGPGLAVHRNPSDFEPQLEWEQWKSFPALEDLCLLHPLAPEFQSSIFEAVVIKKLFQALVPLEILPCLETAVLARDFHPLSLQWLQFSHLVFGLH